MPRLPSSSPQTQRVLATFAARPGEWRYGYDLCREVGIKSGTLYPMLIRLEGQGLLTAEWRQSEKPGRPPRHAYRLTAEGLALARSQAERPLPGAALKGIFA